MKESSCTWLNLPSLGLSIRMLFTGFLLAAGFGLLMAGGQILLTHGMADGKLGLSVDDIVYSYYGNRNNSRLEAKLNGSMKDMASPEVRLELIKWARNGAPVAGWDSHIGSLMQANCVQCHSAVPGLPDFTRLDAAQEVAKVDEGADISSLTRVSHIHLFGISFIFFFVGLIFSLSVGIPRWLKVTVILTPFAFLILDVISWWLTKFTPGFAWLTIIGGFGYTAASGYMWVVSLYQMWVLPRNGKSYQLNAWRD
ncbi:MAG: elongation factor-1 alpha [Gammaproteobacteria bacterium]|nr:elongation factor-1 alpha [Gammaproteobacteria bacterium]